MKSIKSYISREFKNKTKYFLSNSHHTFDEYIGKKKAVVCLGADYGNIGDIAITFAQIAFLKKLLPDYEVFEFPISSTYTDMKSLRSVIDKDDIITIAGGGNTSERYADIEECRQFIISCFPDNTIISFPQSVELANADKEFLSKMQKIYSLPQKLIFFVRDSYSYDAFRRAFPDVRAALAPDTVLTLPVTGTNAERTAVTLSLRNDKESVLTEAEKLLIGKTAAASGLTVIEKDTQNTEDLVFDEKRRRKLLDEQLSIYQRSKMVITDRLHGMILSYITNTPCIVFSGDSTKIKGAYEWISDSKRVIFLDRFDESALQNAVKTFSGFSGFDNRNIDADDMIDIIRETICK